MVKVEASEMGIRVSNSKACSITASDIVPESSSRTVSQSTSIRRVSFENRYPTNNSLARIARGMGMSRTVPTSTISIWLISEVTGTNYDKVEVEGWVDPI
jgi:hypothetical protein